MEISIFNQIEGFPATVVEWQDFKLGACSSDLVEHSCVKEGPPVQIGTRAPKIPNAFVGYFYFEKFKTASSFPWSSLLTR